MQFEGICMMCRTPLLINTVDINGKMRPLCPDCEKMINQKISKSMSIRGKKIAGKTIVFPDAE